MRILFVLVTLLATSSAHALYGCDSPSADHEAIFVEQEDGADETQFEITIDGSFQGKPLIDAYLTASDTEPFYMIPLKLEELDQSPGTMLVLLSLSRKAFLGNACLDVTYGKVSSTPPYITDELVITVPLIFEESAIDNPAPAAY
jgi:hypothetical protein